MFLDDTLEVQTLDRFHCGERHPVLPSDDESVARRGLAAQCIIDDSTWGVDVRLSVTRAMVVMLGNDDESSKREMWSRVQPKLLTIANRDPRPFITSHLHREFADLIVSELQAMRSELDALRLEQSMVCRGEVFHQNEGQCHS